jgi:hypothetical protein
VNTSLDLLIDGERGVWHLANAGAVTWAELLRRRRGGGAHRRGGRGGAPRR